MALTRMQYGVPAAVGDEASDSDANLSAGRGSHRTPLNLKVGVLGSLGSCPGLARVPSIVWAYAEHLSTCCISDAVQLRGTVAGAS